MTRFDYFDTKYYDFLEYSLDYSKSRGYKTEIRPVGFLRLHGGRCIGYCDEGNITLAGFHKLAEPTYVHEFCHTQQLVEEHPLWYVDSDYSKFLKPNCSLASIYKCGVKHFEAFWDAIQLEHDCELRSLKHIKDFDLPVDPERYSQEANLYFFYYHWIYLKKRWSGSTNIYKEELIQQMPTKIVPLSKLRTIDMDLMMVYDEILA